MFFRRIFAYRAKIQKEKYSEICEMIQTLEHNITNESKEVLSNEYKKLQKRWSLIKNSSDEDLDEIMQELYDGDKYYIDLKKEVYIRWQQTLWKSIFLTIYAEFEYDMHQLCKVVKYLKKLKISPKDLNHHGISRSKFYLEKIANFQFDIPEEDWREITNYNKLRNIIAHNAGLLKNSEQLLKNYVVNSEFLSMTKTEELILSKEFIIRIVDLYGDIYHSFCKVLDDYAIENSPPNSFEKLLKL